MIIVVRIGKPHVKKIVPKTEYVFSERYDDVFPDMESYLDHAEGEGDDPETDDVFECDFHKFELPYSHVIERLIEDIAESDEFCVEDWDYEDYKNRLAGITELEDNIKNLFIDFNLKQKDGVYTKSNRRVDVKAWIGPKTPNDIP